MSNNTCILRNQLNLDIYRKADLSSEEENVCKSNRPRDFNLKLHYETILKFRKNCLYAISVISHIGCQGWIWGLIAWVQGYFILLIITVFEINFR